MNTFAATLPLSPRRPARWAGAFTLIEVMVVVGIIGLTLTIGVPAFVRALHKEGMRKAESDLLEACQKARGGAILKNQPQDLIINLTERKIDAPGAFPETMLPDGVSVYSLVVNDIACDKDDVVTVRFYPKGTSDDFKIVIISDRDGSQASITVDPVTALADIETTR